MNKESILFLSLNESKSKKIAQVVQNDSCRRILDFLSNVKDSTETNISQKLGLALSTVHYNLKQLTESKLINIEEFHYSKKGKEVNHYSLANKYIIIAPSYSEGFLEKLKKIIPALVIVSFISLFWVLFNSFKNNFLVNSFKSASVKHRGDMAVVSESVGVPEMVNTGSQNYFEPNIIFWFFMGSVFALLIYFLIDLIKKK